MHDTKKDFSFRIVIEARDKLKDTRWYSWLESTELAIRKQKFLPNRLFIKNVFPKTKSPKYYSCSILMVLTHTCDVINTHVCWFPWYVTNTDWIDLSKQLSILNIYCILTELIEKVISFWCKLVIRQVNTPLLDQGLFARFTIYLD